MNRTDEIQRQYEDKRYYDPQAEIAVGYLLERNKKLEEVAKALWDYAGRLRNEFNDVPLWIEPYLLKILAALKED